jgi:hypothetical protein
VERKLQVGRQKIRFDREATVALYRDKITAAGADECSCAYCKNFAAYRDRAYPEGFVHLLEIIGINPRREWEAFESGLVPGSRREHFYGGWFLFSGELIEGAEEFFGPDRAVFAHRITTCFPTGTLSKDAKLCAVEFATQIPWVVSDIST